MKASILLFSFLFSFVAFGQKKNVRSVPTKSTTPKSAVRTAPRPVSSPVSRPSRPARQSRPAVSRPSKPSSSSSSSTYYAAPSIQEHSTKHPAPSASATSSNSNREPSVITQVHRIQRALPQMPIVRPTGTIHLSPAGQIQIPDTTILLDQ
jgi:hypothetical protein